VRGSFPLARAEATAQAVVAPPPDATRAAISLLTKAQRCRGLGGRLFGELLPLAPVLDLILTCLLAPPSSASGVVAPCLHHAELVCFMEALASPHPGEFFHVQLPQAISAALPVLLRQESGGSSAPVSVGRDNCEAASRIVALWQPLPNHTKTEFCESATEFLLCASRLISTLVLQEE
jgi:hypothetical protein